MKDKFPMIMSISSMEDVLELKKMSNVKYINLDITSPNLEVIYYFIDCGQKYSYSDMIDGKNGYIYVPYDIFREGELVILDIINNIPYDLTRIEKARFLYTSIGKLVGYDINVLEDKTDTFNIGAINTINNIWGCLVNRKGTNISFSKLYLYLCRLMKIDCQLLSASQTGYLKNVLMINNQRIVTDITQDIPFIQAGFKTKYFLGYNDNLELDKKIGYVKDFYSEVKIERTLKDLDYSGKNVVGDILIKTQGIINAGDIQPIELGIIYDIIFSKYCSDYDISINNLFLNVDYDNHEHFIIICSDNKYYSYNYIKDSFVEVSHRELLKNIEEKKIGVYLNEEIPINDLNQERVL